MSAGSGAPVKVTFHGLSASRRTSRRVRYCQDKRSGCIHQIERGDQYVRAVMFPNHDVSGYDRPVVMVICLPCASGSELAPLTAASERGEG